MFIAILDERARLARHAKSMPRLIMGHGMGIAIARWGGCLSIETWFGLVCPSRRTSYWEEPYLISHQQYQALTRLLIVYDEV